MRAQRALLTIIAIATIAIQVLILTGTVTVTISAGKPSAAPMAMLRPAIEAAAQLEPTGITTTAAVTKAPASWTARTCAALSAWEHHQTTAKLNTLVTDSLHLGRSYLRADIGQLNADASSPSTSAWKYVSVSDQYAAEDCWGGA